MKARKFGIGTVTVLVVLLVFAYATNTALAQYSPPMPPNPIIIRETPITVSYTEPQRIITINIAQFDLEQEVKKVTLTLNKPALTASFTIYVLAEMPQEDSKGMALLYFTIRSHEVLLENLGLAKITFAVEKTLIRERGIDEKTIVLDRLFEGEWQELPTRQVDEDERFLFFESESSGLSYFAVRYTPTPFLRYITPSIWWIGIMIGAVVATLVMTEIYLRRSV